jgi:hypothetical protein
MEWLSRHKRKFIALEGIALLCAAAVLVYARSRGSFALEPGEFGLLALPWVVAFGAMLPLIYLSWFGRQRTSPLLLAVKKAFFWAFACVAAFVILALYGTFVFGAR